MKELLVVKVGTSTLMDDQNRSTATFEMIAQQVKMLMNQYSVVLVTSGAIGHGIRELDLLERPAKIDILQAVSSIGQVSLMKRWSVAFDTVSVGQILLTARELRQSFEASRFVDTVRVMHQLQVVPIVNENDAITHEEISFGDNDTLAARVAVTLGATKLILLTDQDGIQRDFASEAQARVPIVALDSAEQYIKMLSSKYGTGGMVSKLTAARLALDSSIETYIADARMQGSIRKVIAGKAGTKIVQ